MSSISVLASCDLPAFRPPHVTHIGARPVEASLAKRAMESVTLAVAAFTTIPFNRDDDTASTHYHHDDDDQEDDDDDDEDGDDE